MNKLKNKSKIKLKDSTENVKYCIGCNPKKYLKFNFSFCKEKGSPSQEGAQHLIKRLSFLSEDTYANSRIKYSGNKQLFIEDVATEKMDIPIPIGFRAIYPTESNEKYSIFRIYPAGTPKGSGNPRIIGMIKNTIFYIFYIDWQGTMYNHN